jgi:hypothetical protein
VALLFPRLFAGRAWEPGRIEGRHLLKLSDGRNFGRTFTGLALIVGPLLMLVATLLGLSVDAQTAAGRFSQIAVNQTAYVLSAILFLVGALFFLGASAGLLHAFRGHGVTLGQLAAGLLMLGTCDGTGFYVFGAIEYQMATTPGFSRPELARFIDASEEASILLPILILFLVGIVIGLIVLGIAAWRRGLIPIWEGGRRSIALQVTRGRPASGV